MENSLSPSWLNDKFLVEVLQSVEDTAEEVVVVKWSCRAAVPPGSNYLSHLYRLSVDYKSGLCNNVRTKSLIVKTPLESGQIKEFMEFINGYGRELQVYNEILPRMYELSRFRLVPRSFVCPLHHSLVLEDLREQGYKMANRLTQLDVAHCRQFLLSLAKFHALSVVVHRQQSDLVEAVGKQGFCTEDAADREKQEMFMKFNLNAMLIVIKKLDGCEKYVDMIESKIESYYEAMVKIYKLSEKLNVLNHGDCWTTNILFKYNDCGEPTDAKLVDFQMCRFGSFAQDIIYFWCTSADEDVRDHHREEMFEVYRQTVNQTLEEHECDERLSKEDFDNEIKNFAPYALQVLSGLLTVAMADPADLMDFNEFSEDEVQKPIAEDSKLIKNFRSKYYAAVLPKVLQQAEELGAFM